MDRERKEEDLRRLEHEIGMLMRYDRAPAKEREQVEDRLRATPGYLFSRYDLGPLGLGDLDYNDQHQLERMLRQRQEKDATLEVHPAVLVPSHLAEPWGALSRRNVARMDGPPRTPSTPDRRSQGKEESAHRAVEGAHDCVLARRATWPRAVRAVFSSSARVPFTQHLAGAAYSSSIGT